MRLSKQILIQRVERSELWTILFGKSPMMSETNPPNKKDKAVDQTKEKDKAVDPTRRLSDQLPPPMTLAEPSLQAIIEGIT